MFQLCKVSNPIILLTFSIISLFGLSCQNQTSNEPRDKNTTATAQETNDQNLSNLIDVEKKLASMDISLTPASPPVANYVNSVRTGNLVFMAGKGPRTEAGDLITGKVGRDLTVEEGYAAARRVAILQLGALKSEIGDLNKVKRIVKVLGMVNCTDDFGNQPEVINGFSDFMVEVFGDRGKHARAAVGMNSLPRNIAVEIEMIVEVE